MPVRGPTAPNHHHNPPNCEAPFDYSAWFSPCIHSICATHAARSLLSDKIEHSTRFPPERGTSFDPPSRHHTLRNLHKTFLRIIVRHVKSDPVSRRDTLLLRGARLAPKQNGLFPGIRLFILFGEHVTRLSVARNNVDMVRPGPFDLVPRELIM